MLADGGPGGQRRVPDVRHRSARDPGGVALRPHLPRVLGRVRVALRANRGPSWDGSSSMIRCTTCSSGSSGRWNITMSPTARSSTGTLLSEHDAPGVDRGFHAAADHRAGLPMPRATARAAITNPAARTRTTRLRTADSTRCAMLRFGATRLAGVELTAVSSVVSVGIVAFLKSDPQGEGVGVVRRLVGVAPCRRSATRGRAHLPKVQRGSEVLAMCSGW